MNLSYLQDLTVVVFLICGLFAATACQYEPVSLTESSDAPIATRAADKPEKDIPAQGCKDGRDEKVIPLRNSDEPVYVGETCYMGNPPRRGEAVRTAPLEGWGSFCIDHSRQAVARRSSLGKVGTPCWLKNQYGPLRGVWSQVCPQKYLLCKQPLL